MANTFQLEIVTPSRLLVKDAAEEAQIPGVTGYLGILPGHAPLITELGVGEITYKASGATHTLSCGVGIYGSAAGQGDDSGGGGGASA